MSFNTDRELTRRNALLLPLSAAGAAAVFSSASLSIAEEEGPWGTTDFFQKSVQRIIDIEIPHSGIPRIASDYGSLRGVSGGMRTEYHRGIDIIDNYDADVLAAADGRAHASYESEGGHYVKVWHPLKYISKIYFPDGSVGEFPMNVSTIYYHLSEAVIDSQLVNRGQVIGKMGRSGTKASNIVHLHFQMVSAGGSYMTAHANPHFLWEKGPGIISCFDPSETYPTDKLVLTYPVRCG